MSWGLSRPSNFIEICLAYSVSARVCVYNKLEYTLYNNFSSGIDYEKVLPLKKKGGGNETKKDTIINWILLYSVVLLFP